MCQCKWLQVMATRRLDIGWHRATSPEGTSKLCSSLGGRTVQMMSNRRNHPYNRSELMRSIIFNQGPTVEEAEPFFWSFYELRFCSSTRWMPLTANAWKLNIGLPIGHSG